MTKTTGQVAERLGQGWSEAKINAVLRRLPSLRPPLKNGRRSWREQDIERLARHLGISCATSAERAE